MSVPTTLSDLERHNARGHIPADTTKFGSVTHVGNSVFLGGQPRPHPKCPPHFGTSHIRAHGMRNSNQFCMIKLQMRGNFTGSTMPPALAKIVVTRMLTRDLFAVASRLVVN